jgi:hypothetical protein
MKSKTNMRACLVGLLLAFTMTWSTSAQTYVRYVKPSDLATSVVYSDTVLTSIALPWGVAKLDNYPKFNAAAYELARVLEDPDKELLQVWVCGSASPDGLWQDNVNLAQARTDAAVRYLKEVLDLPADKIHAENLYEDWDRLAELVEASDIQYKEQVLHIIRTKSWGERKKALQVLDGGRVWKVLLKDFFPKIRCVRFAIFCKWDPSKPYLAVPDEEVKVEPAPAADTALVVPNVTVIDEPQVVRDTVYIRDTVFYFKEVVYMPSEQPAEVPQQQYYQQTKKVRTPREKKYWDTPLYMGLKTNLIADALLIPEVGVEFQLSDKVSFDIQGWATNCNILTPGDEYASMYGFAPEIRRWTRDAMRTGAFVGVHAHIAWYTLQKDGLLYQNGPDNVWQGNYHDSGNATPAWSAGLSLGYVAGFGQKKNWGLEFVLGVGYGRYQQNTAAFNGNTWELVEHQDNHHLGITRAGVNLTYRFNVRRMRPE